MGGGLSGESLDESSPLRFKACCMVIKLHSRGMGHWNLFRLKATLAPQVRKGCRGMVSVEIWVDGVSEGTRNSDFAPAEETDLTIRLSVRSNRRSLLISFWGLGCYCITDMYGA